MDTGTGLFSGLVTLGIIYLYTQTKDRWNWKKIVFAIIGIFLLLVGIFLVSIFWPKLTSQITNVDKPTLVTSYDGISLGDTLADVEFKKGKLKTYEELAREKRKSDSNELYLIDKTFGFYTDIKGNTVTAIVKGCNSDESYSIKINGIYCGDSGEKIIERFGKDVEVKCEVNPDPKESPTRNYDIGKYGVRYQLSKNQVEAFRIYPPKDLLGESKNWKICK
jgi:hypothetical protein